MTVQPEKCLRKKRTCVHFLLRYNIKNNESDQASEALGNALNSNSTYDQTKEINALVDRVVELKYEPYKPVEEKEEPLTEGAKNRANGESIRLDVIKFADWHSFNVFWVDEQMPISANNLVIRCDKCNQKMIFQDDELRFEVVEKHERGMGPELYHYASWEGYCNNDNCNNIIRFSLEVIEYPLGCKTLSHSELHGCELIRRYDV